MLLAMSMLQVSVIVAPAVNRLKAGIRMVTAGAQGSMGLISAAGASRPRVASSAAVEAGTDLRTFPVPNLAVQHVPALGTA
eukprot:15473679-Alexandrium_andersonii.AAC.1